MGRIEVITGSMYAGKTQELLRRINRLKYAKQSALIVKHALDNRYDMEKVIDHNKNGTPCYLATEAEEIGQIITNNGFESFETIAIDEAQFFDSKLVKLVKNLANKLDKRVIIAGLDMDFKGNPFGIIPELMAIADEVLKLKAVCSICGQDAMFSKRTTDSKKQVEIGASEEYIAVCRKHFC